MQFWLVEVLWPYQQRHKSCGRQTITSGLSVPAEGLHDGGGFTGRLEEWPQMWHLGTCVRWDSCIQFVYYMLCLRPRCRYSVQGVDSASGFSPSTASHSLQFMSAKAVITDFLLGFFNLYPLLIASLQITSWFHLESQMPSGIEQHLGEFWIPSPASLAQWACVLEGKLILILVCQRNGICPHCVKCRVYPRSEAELLWIICCLQLASSMNDFLLQAREKPKLFCFHV